jgi:hypothetical protein
MISEGDSIVDRVAIHPMTVRRTSPGPVLVGNDPNIHLGDGTGSTFCGRKWTNDHRADQADITCTACRACWC